VPVKAADVIVGVVDDGVVEGAAVGCVVVVDAGAPVVDGVLDVVLGAVEGATAGAGAVVVAAGAASHRIVARCPRPASPRAAAVGA